jgi:hypothetical protein
LEQYQLWQRFKDWTKENGLDVCRVTLNAVAAFMKAVEGSSDPEQLKTAKGQVIIIQQQNSFVYSVEKPRREPILMNCPNPSSREQSVVLLLRLMSWKRLEG